jgi:hypothetical protein
MGGLVSMIGEIARIAQERAEKKRKTRDAQVVFPSSVHTVGLYERTAILGIAAREDRGQDHRGESSEVRMLTRASWR